MGGILRKFAAERRLDVDEFYKTLDEDSDLDREIDDYQVKLGKTSFYLILHSLKIFFKVDLDIAVDRVYKELYGVNHMDEGNRDIVIDTSGKTVEDVFNEKLPAVRDLIERIN